MHKINVMVFEPGQPGKMKPIDGSLESLQKVVGGYIEQVVLSQAIRAVCNEEGKLKGLEANRWGFVGTFFLARQEGSVYASLTEEDKKVIEELVRRDERLVL